ncbi:MAG: alpha/beta hydrolase [Xanthomonadales bacterium]|nr:alpha/beta hydrolase [Xanthomonadales bacterium]
MTSHDNAPGASAGPAATASAKLLDFETRNVGENAHYAMIWLHGLGADGYDFVPVAQAMPQFNGLGARYYFPHAPMRPVTINNGMVMRAWYDILGFDLRRDEDRNGIAQSLQQVEALRDHIAADGIPHERQILAGFSQGGVIALRSGLGSPRPPLAVLGLSCYLADPEGIEQWKSAAASRIPVFMGHGSQDPVVPMPLGQQARDHLKHAGISVEWHEYPIPHSVSPQEIVDIDTWVLQQIQRAAST